MIVWYKIEPNNVTENTECPQTFVISLLHCAIPVIGYVEVFMIFKKNGRIEQLGKEKYYCCVK